METSGDTRTLMRATPEWMREKYNQFNQELFGGALGECEFDIFTTGKGSQGGVLGWFCVTNKNVEADRYSRRMYIPNYDWRGDRRIFINRENFAEICRPKIRMNGNYSGTEESLCSTLVHEMCHYYDYMSGYYPKQAHGPRFRDIAAWVSSNSGGRFTVQRVADAEVMKGYELSDEMKQKREKRTANAKARMMVVFVFKKDGTVGMMNVSVNDTSLLDTVMRFYQKNHNFDWIITSTDQELIELVYSQGYRKIMRTFRYWDVTNKPFTMDVLKDKYDCKIVLSSMYKNEEKRSLSQIVESVVKEYVMGVESGNDEGIPIAGINLGLETPLEYAEQI